MEEKKLKEYLKAHIHTWNDYKEGKLCCSTCGTTHKEYLHKLTR